MRTNNIKQLRTLKGWSLSKLSKISGIPRSSLGEYEDHKMLITPERVKKLCEVFKIGERDFFKE